MNNMKHKSWEQVRRQIRISTNTLNDITSLTETDVKSIHSASKLIDGWEGTVAQFVTMVYPYTGLRPSELRTMKQEDIHINTWTLVVSHPKGENKYGSKTITFWR